MGIVGKCFEILENKPHGYDQDGLYGSVDPSNGTAYVPLGDDDDDDEEEEMDEEEEGGGEEEEEFEHVDGEETSDDEGDVFPHSGKGKVVKLRLREILFYDDKVSIFKARHGKL